MEAFSYQKKPAHTLQKIYMKSPKSMCSSKHLWPGDAITSDGLVTLQAEKVMTWFLMGAFFFFFASQSWHFSGGVQALYTHRTCMCTKLSEPMVLILFFFFPSAVRWLSITADVCSIGLHFMPNCAVCVWKCRPLMHHCGSPTLTYYWRLFFPH